MKKISLILSILLAIMTLQAQDYQISFAGTGASTTVDTVTVENQTQGKSISLLGSETLHLLAIVTGNAPVLDNVDFPLHIYPNPSPDYFTLEFGARKSGPVTIMFFDLIGREIANLKQTLSSGIHSFRVSGLNYGIYTIKVDLDSQSYSGKLISQGSSNRQLTITYNGNIGDAQKTTKLKNATTERFWQYNTGDILSFTGTSGNISTVIIDVPTKSKVLTFNFTASLPTVTTTAASNITTTGATLGGNVTSDGNATVTERGVVYGILESPTTSNTKVAISLGAGEFSSSVSGLSLNTTYYVRAYAINKQGISYGTQVNFKTGQSLSLAIVTTLDPTIISDISALLGGNVTSDGYATVTECGIVYSNTTNYPTTSNTKVAIGSGPGAFTSTVSGLNANTTYYVRAYAINSKGTAYGVPIKFKTALTLSLADVKTLPATSISLSSAVLGGNVTSDGNAPVTERGVVYGTVASSTTSNTKVAIGSGNGAFTSTVSGLTANTTYYVRAYAINSIGTSSGEEVSFKTGQSLSMPAVITLDATTILSTSAVLGGNVTSDGYDPSTERGIVFSTIANPTTFDTKVINGTGIGTFNSTISGLTPNTTYYVRAYATNSKGTVYGDQVSFKTLVTNPPYRASMCVAFSEYDKSNEVNIPYVENEEISVQSPTRSGTNRLFFSIPADKELSVRNVLHIDITDRFTVVGMDIREGYMNNLIYRYSNMYSTSLSVQFSITISNAEIHNPPLAFTGISMGENTETAWGVTATYALLDETLLSDGNDPTTEHGVMYSTEEDFTSSFTKIVNYSGENEAGSLVYDLSPNTLYYYRAYATNSQGTSYGSMVSFKTAASDKTSPYKAAICVNNAGYDLGHEMAIPYVENKEISVSTPAKAGDNYIYFSIPADKSLIVKDIGGVDITNQFLIDGTDNSPDYQNNYIYRRNQMFSSASSMNLNVTISSIQIPSQTIVTTEEVSSISANTAVLGGSAVNDGTSPITEKGFVISETENPTISDTKIINGLGSGSFSSIISGLTGDTNYFVRAYATDSKGTVYGSQVSFKTLLQYRMAMCVAETEYDKSSEVNIPYTVNKEIKLYSPVKGGTNYFFISIPGNKKFIVKDEMGIDITSKFQNVGEDNRESYWNNNIYKSNKTYVTSLKINFYLTITF